MVKLSMRAGLGPSAFPGWWKVPFAPDDAMIRLKQALRSAMLVPGVRTAFRPFRRGTGTILMLGRLTDPETGAVGHDPTALRRTLAFLRRQGYELIGIGEMFRRLREGPPSEDLGVALTLDDGYAEQLKVAGPIFADFDCPVTIFLTTGFLDGGLWLWWDRIAHVFEETRRRELTTTIAGERLRYRLDSREDSAIACSAFTARCKQVPEGEKLAAIIRLAEAAEVELRTPPPPRYAPMTWADVSAWESRGVTFAPHTVTHPILSRADDEQVRREIVGSWERLRAMVRRPVPVMCYPNGEPGDQGPREWGILEEAGFEGAITSSTGYASVTEFRERPENRFAVRHFACPEDPAMLAQVVSGADRVLHGSGAAG